MNRVLVPLRSFWRRLSWLDLGAALIAAAGGMASLLGGTGGALHFLKFLAAVAAAYLFIRVIGWWRSRLLWSLRNRLIVAYLFIAVVPVLLLAILAVLSGMILYTQLGGFLLYQDLQHRVQMLSDGADHIAAALGSVPQGVSPAAGEKIVASQEHAVYDHALPGLEVEFSDDRTLLDEVSAPPHTRFHGLVQRGDELEAYGIRAVQTPRGVRIVSLRVPMTPQFLATLAPDLGSIHLDVLDRETGKGHNGLVYPFGNVNYAASRRISALNRTLRPAKGWLDPMINGLSKFEAVYIRPDGTVVKSWPAVASFSARPSQLNARMFSSVGELGRLYVIGFTLVSLVFLVLEIAALTTGIVLTRRITKAVDDLYKATQHVKRQDFSYRVQVEHRDQLGELGKSFNEMTGSVSNLIEEQKRRQRLENEISIAREVQNQLFPRSLPAVPGVEIEAVCNAARMVSGDYYDFIQLSPTHLAIAIADISGKGISAALLMASLQAALRSQVLAAGSEHMSTAELVSRLNNHLVRNTADDRFATFFIAIYDSAARTLRYTNAGHLPSLLISDGRVSLLEKGGMVLGVVQDYSYEEGSLAVPGNALVVGYSDGLVEPENEFGEEFGLRRLQDAAVRVHNSAPRVVADSLMLAAEDWAGTQEQADDMTVIVARLR